ncbi:MAG: nucleotidyltransferase family protein [Desulfarculus sp.]|nr:nucleotidyltransferase family protein [Pseudomonadota bacterium]MBV1737178.1 nucleotidyltransferase family protein [Desulfarculus sp.]
MDNLETGMLLCSFISGREIPCSSMDKLKSDGGERLADCALRLNVGGLLYREIKTRDISTETVTINVRKRLRKAYRDTATFNTSLFFDLSKYIKILSDNLIPVIALKGFSLAKYIYGDIALRPMCDVDLLVKKENLVSAGKILLGLGYEPYYAAWEKNLETHHHLPPFTNARGTTIELHWNIVTPDSPIRVNIEELWERAGLVNICDIEVGVLSPEDLFLHLCTHACSHIKSGFPLISLCDISGLLKRSGDNFDWQLAIGKSYQWGSNRCVYLMLLLAQKLLELAPPNNVMANLKPNDFQHYFVNEIEEHIFNISPLDPLLGLANDQFAKIKKIKGVKGKARAVLKRAFPPREDIVRTYSVDISNPKIYLCYLMRIRHILTYYAVVQLGLFRRDQSVKQSVNQAHRVNTIFKWIFP